MDILSHLFYFLVEPSFEFLDPYRHYKTSRRTRSVGGALNTRGGNILQIFSFISETVRDKAITVEH